MNSLERGAFLYKISATSNPTREMKGVQLSGDFNGGGVGGVPGGRNSPSGRHGFPVEGQNWPDTTTD